MVRILNSDPRPKVENERFILSFKRESPSRHAYQFYFMNNSEKVLSNLEVERRHFYYDDTFEADCSNTILRKVIKDIKPYEKVLIHEVNEYDNDVDDFEFNFKIPQEDGVINFSHSIKHKDVMHNFINESRGNNNLTFERIISPCVNITPISYKECNLLSKAIKVAADAHMNQLRKGTTLPYIFHPMEAAKILADNNCSEELMIAALLHDTLEDTNITPDYIKVQFGKEILEVVLGASEPDKDKPDVTWRDRKQRTIEYLKKDASKAVLLVACADKLSNIRSIYKDYQEAGDKIWDRFNAGYKDQKWYYQNLVFSFKGISSFKMYDEFRVLVRKVFGSGH